MASPLDNLPQPDLAEELDYETIYSQLKDRFNTLLPGLTDVTDSDPVFVALQAWAYEEMFVQEEFNNAARANFLATATGADLDNLASLFSVTRLIVTPGDPNANPPIADVLETDESLRERAFRRLEQCANGSPSWYEGLVLEAEAPIRVKDVQAISPAGGQIRIYLLYADHVPVMDQSDVLSKITAFVTADDQKFAGITPVVSAAAPVVFNLTAAVRMVTGSSFGNYRTDIQTVMEEFFTGVERIGRTLYIGEVYEALVGQGVVDTAVITEPKGNVVVADGQYPSVMTITLTEL